MFTIEVKKKEKNEKLGLKNLELSHKECYGGKTILRMESTDGFSVMPFHWEIKVRCERCSSHVELPRTKEQELRISLIKTAVDGKERKIAEDLRVIQKT